jgi:hypothetical protein
VNHFAVSRIEKEQFKMDLVVPTVIATAGSILKGPAQEFLKRVSGPAADELGAWWQDNVRAFRARNAARAVGRAGDILEAAGRQPNEIPLRTLLPLLEGAAKEDDAVLSELWAALLANASIDEGEAVRPIFAATLAQLAPLDAKLLQEIEIAEQRGYAADPLLPNGEAPPGRWGTRRVEILERFSEMSADALEVGLNTLTALGLIEHEPFLRSKDLLGRAHVFMSDGFEFRLSALGRTFMKACRAPT